jgi:predicted DNA-binding transcriptional regulator YafY
VRASRLISLLLLLQTRERMTAQELAEQLEVSVRTVYRDVESLGAAGIPVYGEAGHNGGYRLVDGYRTRLTGLTRTEAESLFLNGLPSAAADLGLSTAVTAAQHKLMAALPAEMREHARRMADRFHLDAPSWYQDPDPAPHLAAVADAVWNQRSIRMRYLRWALPHENTRVVAPHGLVLKAGRWYLVARSAEGLRTYRIARILQVDILDEVFDREDEFDLSSYWQSYLADFAGRGPQDQAVIRLSPLGIHRLPNGARRTAEPDADGWTRVSLPIESIEQGVAEILRLGTDAEVLAPQHLRAAVAHTVEALNGMYCRARPDHATVGGVDRSPLQQAPVIRAAGVR